MFTNNNNVYQGYVFFLFLKELKSNSNLKNSTNRNRKFEVPKKVFTLFRERVMKSTRYDF